MNDIEVLEKFKKNGYHTLMMEYGSRNKTNLALERALENLLKERQSDKERIKELEIENKAFNEGKIFSDEQIKVIKNNCIPKSLIKEKIEELKKAYKKIVGTKEFIEADTIQTKIQVLEELLKGE